VNSTQDTRRTALEKSACWWKNRSPGLWRR